MIRSDEKEEKKGSEKEAKTDITLTDRIIEAAFEKKPAKKQLIIEEIKQFCMTTQKTAMQLIIILQKSFQNIPDTLLDIAIKKELLHSIIPKNIARRIDVVHREHIPVTELKKSSGKVTRQQYFTIEHSVKINASELILLTVGLMANDIKAIQEAQFNKKILPIIDQYLLGNYHECWKAITILSNSNLFEFSPHTRAVIKMEHTEECKKTDLKESEERRFFETKLAQEFFRDPDFKNSIIKIAKNYFKEEIETDEEIENFLGMMCFDDFLPESHQNNVFFISLTEYIQNQLNFSEIRGRVLDTDTEGKVKTNSNINPGIMKSKSAVPLDERTKLRLYAKSDYILAPDLEIESLSKTVYVSGLSGHVHWAIAHALNYASLFKRDPDLSKDINNLLLGFFVFNIKKGYHSFWENYYLFEETFIQELFEQAGIKLRLYFPSEMLLNVFKYTQDFNKITLLNFILKKEFIKLVGLKQDEEKSDEDEKGKEKVQEEEHDEEQSEEELEKEEKNFPLNSWIIPPNSNNGDDGNEDQKSESDDSLFEPLDVNADKVLKHPESDSDTEEKQEKVVNLLETYSAEKALCNKRELLSKLKLRAVLEWLSGSKLNPISSLEMKREKDSKNLFDIQFFLTKTLIEWGGNEDINNNSSREIKLPLDASVLKGKALLQKIAANYGFNCRDVSEDGNCFFYAAADQLVEMNLLGSDETLREDVAFHISHNQKYYRVFFEWNQSFNKYIHNLASPKAWADQFAIEALARLKNVIIVVIPNEEKGNINIFKPANARATIFLGYEVNRHFQSLQPMDEKTLSQEQQKNLNQLKELIQNHATLPPLEEKQVIPAQGLFQKKAKDDMSITQSPTPPQIEKRRHSFS